MSTPNPPTQGTTVLGRYVLGEVIGTGGMGTVLGARDTVLDRDVAVKLLRDEFAGDEATIARFRSEARIAASLTHPGIAHVYDFGEQDGRAFIVMEKLSGRDLHQTLAQEGPMDPERAAAVAAEAADAIHAAHLAGAVHRDIKPGNIFITEAGAVKVTDFGIAKVAGMSATTTAGQILGTPFYLSPEQVAGEPATAKSDVYALGCVLYQMLTSSPPFQAEDSISVALLHQSAPIPSARSEDPSIPRDIDAVIERAMQKEPADRFPTAADMASALRAVASQSPATVAIDSPRTEVLAPLEPVTRVVGAIPRRRRRAIAAVAIVALVLAGLALIANRTGDTPPSQVTVPEMRGLSLAQARDAAEEEGITLAVSERRLSDKPADTVLEQSVGPGTPAAPGATINVAVSDGNGVSVPQLEGLSKDDAKSKLEEVGLGMAVTEQESEEPEGTVIAQDPAPGAVAARDSEVRLTISKGSDDKKDRGRDKGDD